VVYNLVVQSPQYSIDSLDALLRTPVRPSAAAGTSTPQLLSNLVQVTPAVQSAVESRYNLAPAIDIYSSAQGRDMGGISRDIFKLVAEMRPHAAARRERQVLGQAQTMKSSFIELGVGLVMAVVMVYLLIVVNFQSWTDAFIIITALPAALAGHLLDAVSERHHVERAGVDRRHHDHGCCHGQQHFDRFLRASAHGRGPGPGRGALGCGKRPASGRC
jgi:multidrug efflux pump subunit AcrB